MQSTIQVSYQVKQTLNSEEKNSGEFSKRLTEIILKYNFLKKRKTQEENFSQLVSERVVLQVGDHWIVGAPSL